MPTRFSRFGLAAVSALLVILALLYLIRPDEDTAPEAPPAPSAEAPPARSENPPPPPIGDDFLKEYASPSTTPVQDLENFGHALESMLNLFKNLDTRLIATNSELAAFFRGQNIENLVFISPDHPVFNPEGLLVDRWKSPLIVHPLGTGLIQIRSAGPDRLPYSEDDLIFDPAAGRAISPATLDSMPLHPPQR